MSILFGNFYPVYYILTPCFDPSTSYLVRYGRSMTNVSIRGKLPIECDHIHCVTLVPGLYRYYGVLCTTQDDILPSILLLLSVSPLTECFMFGFVPSYGWHMVQS